MRQGWPPLGIYELGIEHMHRPARNGEQSHRIPHDVAVPISAIKKTALAERSAGQTRLRSDEDMPSRSTREA